MGVIAPSPTVGFNFDSPCIWPYISAPSSPQRLSSTYFYSAPASPARASAFCLQDFHGGDACSPSSAVPFYWETKPGIPKEEYISDAGDREHGFRGTKDFEFDHFSGNFETCSLSADELFDGGKIRPLKPPPAFQYKPLGSPKSPRSPTKLIVEALSPRRMKKDFDPFAAALEQARISSTQERRNGDTRGREKGISRSLSPFRVSDHMLSNQEPTEKYSSPDSSSASLSSASSFFSLWHKKWKIRDLLLFRSASESWDKDRMKQKKTHDQDEFTESSFSSTASGESESSRRRSMPPISAHELHYSVKRTVLEEMGKRRSLSPRRQGILGCLGFHRTVPAIHENPNS